MKHAVLSMDVEDWYHLEYFRGKGCDREYSMLDGLDRYLDELSRRGLPSSFFVLGELAQKLKLRLRSLADSGHDVASHGWGHRRPMETSPDDFQQELLRCRAELESILGRPCLGFRAPCFSLDRSRLDRVRRSGFKYDSSRICFSEHPLYGDLDLSGYRQASDGIYHDEDFYEFEVSTQAVGKKQIPVSGGGYLRIFPWALTKALLRRYLAAHSLYVLYLHPFETSERANPVYPQGTPGLTRLRFAAGRAGVREKLNRLIDYLKEQGYEFTTFDRLRTLHMNSQSEQNV